MRLDRDEVLGAAGPTGTARSSARPSRPRRPGGRRPSARRSLRPLAVRVVDDARRQPEHAALDSLERLEVGGGRLGASWWCRSRAYYAIDQLYGHYRRPDQRRQRRLPGARAPPRVRRGDAGARSTASAPGSRLRARASRATRSSPRTSASAAPSCARRSTSCGERGSSTSGAGNRGGVFVRSLAIPTALLTDRTRAARSRRSASSSRPAVRSRRRARCSPSERASERRPRRARGPRQRARLGA